MKTQKSWLPLHSDEFRAGSTASRYKLCWALLLGVILEALGIQTGRQNPCLRCFSGMLFSNALLSRFLLYLFRHRTRNIAIFPTKNKEFCKISVSNTHTKKACFCLNFLEPKPRKFDENMSPKIFPFLMLILMRFLEILASL